MIHGLSLPDYMKLACVNWKTEQRQEGREARSWDESSGAKKLLMAAFLFPHCHPFGAEMLQEARLAQLMGRIPSSQSLVRVFACRLYFPG